VTVVDPKSAVPPKLLAAGQPPHGINLDGIILDDDDRFV
jgi:hypothetical protein